MWLLIFFRSRRTCAHQLFDGMPSSREKKKLKLKAVASGEDRISTLSDKILHRMLAFLPAHEAVQTCALSRRWRNVWKSMRVLRVIDFKDFRSPAEFNYFVNNLLFFRDLAPLDEFEFMTYLFVHTIVPTAFWDDVEPIRYLEMWIQYALMCRVRVLRVLVRSDRDIAPGRLANMPLFSQHLTTLELLCVALDGCSMDFSGCPVLEDLKIRDSKIRAQRMSSQSLRRLHVSSCDFSSDIRLRIFAPTLFALKLDDNWGRTPFLESKSMPLLVTAYISLWMCDDRCRHNEYGDCGFGTCVDCYGDPQCSEKCVLLGGLSNVTHLEFEASPRVTIFKRDLKWCPTFNKLKTLALNCWAVGCLTYNVFHALKCILQHAPVLEKLTLKLNNELGYKLKVEKSCSPVEQFLPSEHLKIVEVICSKVDGNYITFFVKLLTAYGISPDITNIRGT